MKNSRSFSGKFNWMVKGRLFGIGTGPEADWKFIFISSIILTVIIIALSIYIFIKIDKGEIFVAETAVPQGGQSLDLAALRETVSYYQGKMIEFETITRGATSTRYFDPSL